MRCVWVAVDAGETRDSLDAGSGLRTSYRAPTTTGIVWPEPGPFCVRGHGGVVISATFTD